MQCVGIQVWNRPCGGLVQTCWNLAPFFIRANFNLKMAESQKRKKTKKSYIQNAKKVDERLSLRRRATWTKLYWCQLCWQWDFCPDWQKPFTVHLFSFFLIMIVFESLPLISLMGTATCIEGAVRRRAGNSDHLQQPGAAMRSWSIQSSERGISGLTILSTCVSVASYRDI